MGNQFWVILLTQNFDLLMMGKMLKIETTATAQ